MHIPVLSKEILEQLEIAPNDVVLDGTLGGGGHAVLMTQALGPKGIFIGIDQDSAAIERARERLAEATCTVHLEEANFRKLDEVLAHAKVQSIDKALFDLGWSSFQIEDPNRGFSFQADGPLSMTYKMSPGENDITAEDIVNDWDEQVIRDLLSVFGEERYAKRIAQGIVFSRKGKRITRTGELVEIIERNVPDHYRRAHLHPATRTFQALRITVNDEFGALKEVLHKTIAALSSNGRIAVITFHSGEDRIVKTIFKEYESKEIIKKLTKKPIVPSDDELKENRRSRSAKLRTIEKI